MSLSETIIRETLAAAYIPATVADPRAVVETALELFADNLNAATTEAFAAALGGDVASRIRVRSDKFERNADALIEAVAQAAGVDAAVADDVLGALFEVLWRHFDRDRMQVLIDQCPNDLARWLMASIPGEARGRF